MYIMQETEGNQIDEEVFAAAEQEVADEFTPEVAPELGLKETGYDPQFNNYSILEEQPPELLRTHDTYLARHNETGALVVLKRQQYLEDAPRVAHVSAVLRGQISLSIPEAIVLQNESGEDTEWNAIEYIPLTSLSRFVATQGDPVLVRQAIEQAFLFADDDLKRLAGEGLIVKGEQKYYRHYDLNSRSLLIHENGDLQALVDVGYLVDSPGKVDHEKNVLAGSLYVNLWSNPHLKDDEELIELVDNLYGDDSVRKHLEWFGVDVSTKERA